MKRWAAALGGLVMGYGVVCTAASAQESAAAFFQGKTISLQVGSSPGGGSSDYAVAVARHMGRHMPGQPAVIVQHVPGAGGLLVANNLYNVAPRDGTVLGITSRAFIVANILGNANARYDARKFGWIGSSATEYSTCFSWQTARAKTLADLQRIDLIVGAAGQEGTAAVFAKMVDTLLGTRIKTISGYPGSTEVLLALERGEIDGYCGLSWTFIKLRKQDWLTEKKINLLFQMGPAKHPDLPDVPFISDSAKSTEDRQVFDFFLTPQALGRPFFAPPNLPPARLAALQAAFAETLHDPRYLDDARKLNLDVDYVGPDAAQKIVDELYALPPTVIARAAEIMK